MSLFCELCCCLYAETAALLLFHPVWFPTEEQAGTDWVLFLLTLTENYTFPDLLEKALGTPKLLFRVSQCFNNFFGGKKLRSFLQLVLAFFGGAEGSYSHRGWEKSFKYHTRTRPLQCREEAGWGVVCKVTPQTYCWVFLFKSMLET